MTKEEKREYNRVWKLNHPDRVKAYAKKSVERNRQYRLKHRERYLKYARKYRKENPEKCNQYQHRNRLKRLYGITPEDYNRMFLEQNESCAICRTPQKNLKRKLHVDHNHTTGKSRGLLCVNCNHSVGCFERDSSFLDNVKKYLEKWSR